MGFGSSKQKKQEKESTLSSGNAINIKENESKVQNEETTEQMINSILKNIETKTENNNKENEETTEQMINSILKNIETKEESNNNKEKEESSEQMFGAGKNEESKESKNNESFKEKKQNVNIFYIEDENFSKEHKKQNAAKTVIYKENDSKIRKKNDLNVTLLKTVTNEKLNNIITVQEISDQRIGVLNEDFLLIFSLNDFSIINTIQFEQKELFSTTQNEYTVYEDRENGSKGKCEGKIYQIKDFIELKNNNIILWSEIKIFIYTFQNKEYKLLQTINEIENIEYNDKEFFGMGGQGYVYYKELNSIKELSNGNLIACNCSGFNIYENKDNKYILKSIIRNQFLSSIYDVIYAIEINLNKYILLQRHRNFPEGCDPYEKYDFGISIYNVGIEELKCLDRDTTIINNDINYIIKNGYLLVNYGDCLTILKILGDNIQLIKKYLNFFSSNIIHAYDKSLISRIICNYFNDLILISINNELKLYSFKKESLEYYCDFINYEMETLKLEYLEDINVIKKKERIIGVIQLANSILSVEYSKDKIFIKMYLTD